MKKSLIALAALAATSAFAQSSVTLYGRAEAGVDLAFRTTVDRSFRDTIVGPGAASVAGNDGGSKSNPGFRVQDGNNQGLGSSRFGMRGTEDLGGGLKANFVMEAGLNLDDGTTGNGGGNFFSRSAWVGLSGGFGEVRLGRQVLGSFGVHASGLALGAANGLYETGATIAQGGVRFSNAIQYRSPDFGGISGTISLSAPEGKGDTSVNTLNGLGQTVSTATTSTSPKTGVDLSIAYANGPIYVGFGYNKQSTASTTNNGLVGPLNATTSSSGPRTDYTISASYNFGVAQPFFNYTNRNERSTILNTAGGVVTQIGGTSLNALGSPLGNGGVNAKSRQYAFGVKVPVGAATLVTSFGTHKTTGSANDLTNTVNSSVERKVRAFQIGGLYPLSKRTTLMANYGVNNTKDATTQTLLTTPNAGSNNNDFTTTKTRGLNFGVQHLF